MHHRHSNDSLLLSLMFVLAVHATLKFLAVVVTEVDRREAASPFLKANPRWIEDVEVNRLALHMCDALDGGWKSQTHMRTASEQTSL
jgi:hypothetical protein